MHSRGEQPVDVEYNGLKLRLYPTDSTLDAKILTSSRLREKQELAFLKPTFASGGTFVDVGANSGYYSLMAVSDGAERVLAVEANPEMCRRLEFNAQASDFLDRIEVCQVALGDREGTADLLLLGGDQGSNRIARGAEAGERVAVPMKTLLSLLREKNIERIDAMKIDVEGMEEAVLLPFFEEAPQSLWPACVIIEYVQQNDWEIDLLARLKKLGYASMGRTRSNELLRLRPSAKPST
jgi:FkbM family methyltransferase